MTLMITLDNCAPIPQQQLAKMFLDKTLPKGKGGAWSLYNEIKPSDLYCYLYCKFGPPNGLQNILRDDDSDNLIHWDWTLAHKLGLITIQGMNIRSEVQLMGDWDFPNCHREQFISYIKRDIANYGKEMSKFREEVLEDWVMFVNPYQQLRDAIEELKGELDGLELNPAVQKIPHIPAQNSADVVQKWKELGHKYSKGAGLAIGIRAMAPVLAESYINLLLFILCRQDIKDNDRLYTAAVRTNIDIKVQSLHINCTNFSNAVDWKSSECKAYNSVINERNDMLHGNVVIDKQKFSETYFLEKVPVFKQYADFWEQSIGVSIEACGLRRVQSDLDAIDEFIAYVTSCLEPRARQDIEFLSSRLHLGWNKKTKRVGVLFPKHIVDIRPMRLTLPR